MKCFAANAKAHVGQAVARQAESAVTRRPAREKLSHGLRTFGANPPYDYTLQLLGRYPAHQERRDMTRSMTPP